MLRSSTIFLRKFNLDWVIFEAAVGLTFASASALLVLFFLLDLLEHQFKDLKQGEDREAEEEAKVASNVGHKVVLGVDLEVGVDLYIRGKLKLTLSKRIIE